MSTITVCDMPCLNSRSFPNKTAFIFEDQHLSWPEVEERSRRLAVALNRNGLAHGQRVALLAANSADWMCVYFGVLRAGCVLTPLNVQFGLADIEASLRHSEAVALIVDPDLIAGHGEALQESCPELRSLVASTPSGEFTLSIDGLVDSVAPDCTLETTVNPTDDALIMYTGGTTGRPKGAIITHDNHYSMLLGAMASCDVKEWDINLTVLPLYHNAGLHMTLKCSLGGATTIIHKRPNAQHMFEDIAKYSVTRSAIVTGVLQMLLREAVDQDLEPVSTVRWMMAAGSILTMELFQAVRQLFPNADFVQGYGLTDATSLITVLQARHALEREGSCGKPFVNTEIKIADGLGGEAKPGTAGEILVRGDTVMRGYLNAPDLTAATIRDGWLHTGDLGRMDEEGFLYFSDRLKDIIRSGDETIFAIDLENILYTHPEIVDGAVIAVPHERWIETPCAVVVRRADSQLTEHEVIEFVNQRVPSRYMAITEVHFVEQLPRTHIGKIFKPELRDQFA